MITLGNWRDALFVIIVVANAIIGIVQETRAKIALDRLTVLTAPAAKIIRDGEDREVPVADVVLDDVLRISAGDQIVADGETLESASLEVDESLLTGESVPVTKEPGDALLSGSFVVAGGGLFRATAVGADAYAQRLTHEGKRYTRLHSDLVTGINSILRLVGSVIIPVGALYVWAQFRMGATVEEGVTNTVAAMVAMVPQGLVLLCSIAFAVSAITLARRNVLTRELPAVEALARVDVLCIDKTGTITEPHPAFERYHPLGVPGSSSVPPPGLAIEALGAMAATAGHRNSTLEAIAESLPAPDGWLSEYSVPFSSARKWSASRFDGRGSWVLGAPEIVAADEAPAAPHIPRAAAVRAEAAELAADGLRVLLLSHTDGELSGESLPAGLMPLGLVILSERVRPDAPQTLRYFQDQGVQIKVISGDNPATVATIAGKAGVPGADLAFDSRYLPEGEDLANLMETTTIFGRVNPDQKLAMVEALQGRGHTVAMTGDGVNDVLALKKADLGIAMGTGTAAARAVAQLVLVDSRFATLPGVVAEGRRVAANIERVAHLFINKTVWAALLALAVAAVSVPYPVLPRHLSVVDTLIIGIPGFFLALAPNPRRFVPGFVRRVARFVLPTGLLSAIMVLLSYYLVREAGATVGEARAMETIIFGIIGLRVIAAIERPVRGWRLGLILVMAGLLAGAFLIPYTRDFFALYVPGWRVVGITAAMGIASWFVVGLGWRIGRRLPFWREAAARTETR
ncbi:MAG TPA: HAD-IC family P-type ATPase [Thermoleophilia bacterium]|nr:HAD-IC family P-type ATPase [Thermoleophilia bacterium]